MKSLTLRTPTLDDVFLQLTGSHLQADEANDNAPGATTDTGPDAVAPSPPPAPALSAPGRPSPGGPP